MTRKPFLPAEPSVGARLLIVDQAFKLVRKITFRRRDGSEGVLLGWETACAECGATFQTSSALHGGSPTRRCRQHRKPGRAVGKHRRSLNVLVIEPEIAP